jgi:ABC-type amino acid transport substrate-binding protein
MLVHIFLFSSFANAETVSLCSLDRPTLSEADGSGYYWDLLRAVFESEGIDLKNTAAPFTRCLHELEGKHIDGAVAVFKTPERSEKFTYSKSRLGYSSYGLIYLKGTPFNSIDDVTGGVGLIRGYDFSAWLPSKLNLVNVRNIPQAIRMLKLAHISYHADDIQDIVNALNKMQENPDKFVLKTLYINDLYLPFRKDERGQMLADKFDSGLRKVYENGTLAELTEKYGVIASILPDFIQNQD